MSVDRYAKVQSSLWGSQRFEALSRFERLTYFYLLTNEHNNSIGLYALKAKYALVDLKCTAKAYNKAVGILSAAALIAADSVSETVFIYNYLRYNPFTSSKHAKGSINLANKYLDSPLYPLLYRDIEKYCSRYVGLFPYPIDSLSIAYRYTDTDTDTETDTNTETNTNTNTNTNTEAADDSICSVVRVTETEEIKAARPDDRERIGKAKGRPEGKGKLADFLQFWQLYPRQEAKGRAEKAYLAALELTDHETIMAACQAYLVYHSSLGTETRFLKHPTTWLDGRCWEDRLPTPTAKAGKKAPPSPYSVLLHKTGKKKGMEPDG